MIRYLSKILLSTRSFLWRGQVCRYEWNKNGLLLFKVYSRSHLPYYSIIFFAVALAFFKVNKIFVSSTAVIAILYAFSFGTWRCVLSTVSVCVKSRRVFALKPFLLLPVRSQWQKLLYHLPLDPTNPWSPLELLFGPWWWLNLCSALTFPYFMASLSILTSMQLEILSTPGWSQRSSDYLLKRWQYSIFIKCTVSQ